MTKIDEQHKANEIVRANTIENEGLYHDARVKDILLANADIAKTEYKEDKCSEANDKKLEKPDIKKYNSLPSSIGLSLLAEDAAYQVGLATIKGEHKQKREEENYLRLMVAMGIPKYTTSLEILKEEEKKAKKLLEGLGYKISKGSKKKK